jgi:hypothetical protein
MKEYDSLRVMEERQRRARAKGNVRQEALHVAISIASA